MMSELLSFLCGAALMWFVTGIVADMHMQRLRVVQRMSRRRFVRRGSLPYRVAQVKRQARHWMERRS